MLAGGDARRSHLVLSARAPLTHVEVEVIAMSFVVVGAQDDVEEATCTIPDGPQERGSWRMSVPVGQNADLRTIRQSKARDVDCIGCCMLAATPAHAVVQVAT